MTAAQRLLQSHRDLARFAGAMLGCYVAWFVVYDLWLRPDGRLDAALSGALATATGALVSALPSEAVVDGRIVRWGGGAVEIADSCNGLAALSLFVGFVLAFPGTWARRLVFVPAGLAVIAAANVARCAGLLVVQARWPEAFGVLHGSGSMLVFYAVIVALWVAWAHVGGVRAPRLAA